MALLDRAANLYGTVGPGIRARIMRFMDSPSEETWEDIHGLLISTTRPNTIWQAVIAIDPTFPRTKKTNWKRIPDPFTVARAIREATKARSRTT